MHKFDINSAKFVSIIIGICFIFTMVIWHAFSYLPKEIPNIETTPNSNISSEAKTSDKITESEKPVQLKEEEKNTIQNLAQENKKKETKSELKPLETIYEDTPGETISDNSITKNDESNIARIEDLMLSEKYTEALELCKKTIEYSNDDSVKARAYEKMANIYAISRHYGSALSAAQRAFNLKPTTSRETLLARLYYKTGDIDKATSRINNVLRRDFKVNDK